MLFPRYRAASIKKKDLVWMLGGRDGSNILQDNEVLLYPASWEGSDYDVRKWEWAHKKMKNILIWDNIVPEGMKRLPMPLTGQCAVNINDRYAIVTGGATLQSHPDGSFVAFSKQVISGHVHLYDFSNDAWASTYGDAKVNGRYLTEMRIPRMNHACAVFEEAGSKKVIVVGGVTTDSEQGHRMEISAEILDFDNLEWVFATDLPKSVTGSKLLVLDGRPALAGRYGDERQQALLRYSQLEEWEELPIQLLHGRSDFQILGNIPKLVTLHPVMSSHSTMINPGTCATSNWRNIIGLVEKGKKAIIRTNYQLQPWIQLDLGKELFIVSVSIKYPYLFI